MHEVKEAELLVNKKGIYADVWLMSKKATGICLVGEETKPVHAFDLRKKIM